MKHLFILCLLFLSIYASANELPECKLIGADKYAFGSISKYKMAHFLSFKEIQSHPGMRNHLPSKTLFSKPIECYARVAPSLDAKSVHFKYQINKQKVTMGSSFIFPQAGLSKGKARFFNTIVSYSEPPKYIYISGKPAHNYDQIPNFYNKIKLFHIHKTEKNGITQHYAYGAEIQFLDPPHTNERFIKLDKSGKMLSDDAPKWACVRDEETGLIWETKTDDGGIHDKDNRYLFGDWQELLEGSNKEQLCGFNDWRIPNNNEADSIKDKTKLLTRKKVASLLHPNFFRHHEITWVKVPKSPEKNAKQAYIFDISLPFSETKLHLQGCDGCSAAMDFVQRRKDKIMTRLVRGPKTLPPIIRPKPSPRMDG